MSPRSFDVVIVGAGPAGLEAAATVAEAGLRCIAIDKMGPGGQLMNMGVVIGMPDVEAGTMGPDLLAQLAERAMSAGAEIAIDDVARVRSSGDFTVEGLDGVYRAKAVVVATGLSQGTTGLADETRFEGAGLSHCATCDAPMFSGKVVAVAGHDSWAVEEAIELAGHASQVALVADAPLRAANDRIELLRALGNVVVVDGRIMGLEGADALEGIVIEGAAGQRRVETRGLFLQVGRCPAKDFLDNNLANAGGLFLAGDVREGSDRTLTEAIADGARAGHNAIRWARASQDDV